MSFAFFRLRVLSFILLGLFCFSLSWGAWVAYRTYESQQTLNKAQRLLEEGNYKDLLVLSNHYYHPHTSSEVNTRWENFKLKALLGLEDEEGLVAFYAEAVGPFKYDEAASLFLLKSLYHLKRDDAAALLRDYWRGRELHLSAWVFLETEEAVALHKKDEAKRILKAVRFTGKDETVRLLKLSSLETDPLLVKQILDEALEQSPDDLSVHFARADFFESQQCLGEAQAEYSKLLSLYPKNPHIYEVFGNFCYRNHEILQALQLWIQGAELTQNGALWLKAYTANKILKTSPLMPLLSEEKKQSQVLLSSVCNVLSSSSDSMFLPASLMQDQEALRSFGDLAFLGALEALRLKDPKKAATYLQSPFEASTQVFARLPQAILSAYLSLILKDEFFLSKKFLSIKGVITTSEPFSPTLKHFLDLAWQRAATKGSSHSILSAKDSAFLSNESSFALLMALAGFPAASIRLSPALTFDEKLPHDALFAYANSLLIEKGPVAAWSFIPSTVKDPHFQIFKGQLGLASPATRTEALHYLESLAALPNMELQAGFLCVSAYLDAKDPISAEALLIRSPVLLQSTEGQLAFAQCAVLEKNFDLAEVRYLSIAKKTPEASDFLWKRALERGNWHKAMLHLRYLNECYPGRKDYQEALQGLANRGNER